MGTLADKTIANMEELTTANSAIQGPMPRTEYEKQRLHVEASLARCRRCGDFAPAFPVAAPLATICGDCETALKKSDGCMWFVDMLNEISKGKKS